ncbi:hypothetical protein SAMN06298216_3556 [Spirosomataceae bacterium TFI 002]|nr:hypothetical protein SAMN06298216_3556 [Spirosomataceae bacterium TFI 002]
MNKYKIEIELKSHTLPAGNGSELQYDSEPHFDSFGFPYLPGKTFKGLSRESTMEVLELMGKGDGILSTLYGKPDRSGSHFGKLHFSNFYIPDYVDTIRPYLFDNEPTLQEIKRLRAYFTTALSRTAIENGVAKKGSLRTFSVLDSSRVTHFESEFIADLNQGEELILKRSNLHLTRIGLARNRGLGLVKARLSDPFKIQPVNYNYTWPKEANEIAVKLTLLSPLINNESGGDNFHIESGDVINGNKLIGLYAGEYLKSSKNADETFENYFLKDKLQFSSLTKNGASVIPLNIQYSKYDKPNALGKPSIFYDMFTKDENDITKPLGGFFHNGEKLKVKKVRNFHTSRPVRTAGRAFENDGNGDIFAIEALGPGQVFKGTISGQQEELEKFYVQFAGLKNARMGKSKYTQYGNIKIELEPRTINREKINNPGYLLIETPLVLLNEDGNPDFSIESFNSYFPDITFDFNNAILAEQSIKSYRSDWKTPTDPITALKPGSIIKISKTENVQFTSFSIGEFQAMGLGKVKLLSQNEITEILASLSTGPIKNAKKPEIELPIQLKTIRDAIDSEIKEQEHIYQAIKRAYNDFLSGSKITTIRSSRISRVILALKTATDINSLKEFFNKNNKSVFKDAGKELDDKGVFNLIVRNTPKDANFSNYWTQYFMQIRKLKKSKDNG